MDRGQNHAATRDIEQLAEMLDRVRLHRSLSQDFVATLELTKELIVQVVLIGQENQRRILHRRLFNDAAGGTNACALTKSPT
jgi:hypothetical protein